MTNIREVSRFIIKCKFAIRNNFIFEWTEKNKLTLIELGYNLDDVEDVITSLSKADYTKGPLHDLDGYKGDFWLFGRTIQNREIYIKLKIKDFNTTGDKKLSVYCISFHFADEPQSNPFK